MTGAPVKSTNDWEKRMMTERLAWQSSEATAQSNPMPDDDGPATEDGQAHACTDLLGDGKESSAVQLQLDDVIDSPYQPRLRPIARKDVEDLMRSIAAAGQVSPIVVSPAEGEHQGKYYVHSGHRRCAALRGLGAKKVVAFVRDLKEREARKLALADNIGREDLSAFEQATALKSYCEMYGLSNKDGALDLGIKLRTAERLRSIAECSSEPLMNILRESNVSTKAADLLVKIEKRVPKKGVRLAKKWIEQKLTQKDLEAELRKSGNAPARVPVKRDVVLRADDKVVELKVYVIRETRSDVQDERIRGALCELMWHLEIPHLDAAPAEEAVA
jgi:ParB family chromosome partitioning protein